MRRLFFIFMFFIPATVLFAQQVVMDRKRMNGNSVIEDSYGENKDELRGGNVLIMLLPQYFIDDQMRIDVDIRLHKKQWLTMSGEYLFVENAKQGLGIGAAYRYYTSAHPRYYVSARGIWRYSSQDVSDEYNDIQNSRVIQYGVDVLNGWMFQVSPRLYLDFYCGIGWRFAGYSSCNTTVQKNIKKDFFGYGYKGPMLCLGIRFGTML